MSRALNSKQMSNVVEFVSAVDAVEMSREDICNVEPVTPKEINEYMVRIAERFQPSAAARTAYDEWEANQQEWRDADIRWSLTPHQLAKVPAGKKLAK